MSEDERSIRSEKRHDGLREEDGSHSAARKKDGALRPDGLPIIVMIQLLEEAAMGFTVRDFNDLMRLLDRHPEWVEALRQRLLTRELLDSPKTLRRLSRRVGRVERAVEDLKATVQDLAQSVQALTQSVAALIQAQQQRDEAFAAFRAEVDRRFAELAEAQRRHYEEFAAHRAETDRRFAELAEAQRRHYEEFVAHRAETDRRFAELAEAQRRHYEEFVAHRAETDRRFAELAEAQRRHYEEFAAHRAETDRRFAELAEAQRRHYEEFAAHRREFLEYRAETDRRFAELAEAQRRHYEEFAAHRAETDRRFAELAEAQRRHYEEFAAHRQEFLEYRAETDRRFAELAEAIQALAQRVDNLSGQVRGWVHEDRYRTRPRRYRRLLLDPHILSTEAREALLRQAEAAGRLTPEEAAELEDADVLVQGRSRATGGEAFLVVEVSAKVNTDDVERAVKRAEILRKARPEAEVIPVAAGPEIHPLAARAARDRGVWWLTDGRPYAPHEIPK
jgi:predicted  nucleic acid-binding Zn-ribbon protein